MEFHNLSTKCKDHFNLEIEDIYMKSLIGKKSLLNLKELSCIIPGVYFNRTFIQLSNIEIIDFEYNFNNEYKVYVNEFLVGYVYIYPGVDHNQAFREIEASLKISFCAIEDFDVFYLRNQIEKEVSNIFISNVYDKTIPFYREMEYKNKKKGYRCLKHS